MNNELAKKTDQGVFIKTLNNMGFMTNFLDEYSQVFVEDSSKSFLPCLEVGCAFGIASIPALENGARVIANDIDSRHLEILKNSVSKDQKKRLTLMPGSFPTDLNISENSLQCVLACRILHFFTGDEIDLALSSVYRWLAPGGNFYVVCETPYLKNIRSFIPIYEQRKKEGLKWPGEVKNFNEIDERGAFNLPTFMHFFDLEILEKKLMEHGFKVKKISYISRENFPEDIKFDGRESVGAIAQKI